MTQELRIGVIGTSQRGKLADHAHKPGDGSRIVAGADVKQAALDEFRAKYPNTFTTTDWREFTTRDDIDAVFILTPDFLHEEMAVALLTAGKSVYLEKPMAISTESCDRILAAAVKSNTKIFVGHNMRYMRVIRKMKELIDSGAIGEVKTAWCRHFVGCGGDFYYQDWHADRSKVHSLLLQKGAHDLDVLHWLCGGYATRVNGIGNLTVYNQISDRHDNAPDREYNIFRGTYPPAAQTQLNPVIDVEDLSLVQMELDNGVLCSYQQCHYTPDYWRNYTIIGTEGRIENCGDDPNNGGAVIRLWNKHVRYNRDGDEQYTIPKQTGTHGGSDPDIVAEFLAYVRGDVEKTATNPIAARMAVAAGCAATESLRSDSRCIEIPPLDQSIIDYFG
jgi:predicted dehydrogenase